MTDVDTIGPYRLLEPIGHGGMGVVYRARRVGSERAVALKTVRVPAAQWFDSLRREVEALTRIRHPGIVRIVDHGVDTGRPWYAMDLLEGESLRHYGQRIWSPYVEASVPRQSTYEPVSATEELPVSEPAASSQSRFIRSAPALAAKNESLAAAAGELRAVLRIVRRLCATLAFLHGEGFVNCDLKPENILLVEGDPVIIDFGLTAHHPGGSGREELESQRGASGTLPYMSPEQLRGEFLDARSDIYSLGCVLYELVAGRAPFTGVPRAVRMQHLSTPPTPPSDYVRDVPPALERILSKLLAKNLVERFGFADEVADLLAQLTGDGARLSDFPPARPYLYRPRFVGREALVHELSELRDRTLTGVGTFVLLGGESGGGKTRLAMELTRRPSFPQQLRVVTQDHSASRIDGSTIGAGSSPLQALRPILQAVADCCHEGGGEVAERLLGPHWPLLSAYEPAFEHVPHPARSKPITTLSAEAARQRLFDCLKDTLAAFAREQPIFWILDDLTWADDLSLGFLRSLSAGYFASNPIFILGTYRLEEVNASLASLSGLPYVKHLVLRPLEHTAIASIVGDMLALTEQREDFVRFVSEQAEGNPFFVSEHVRTAVFEQVIYRDRSHAWRFQEPRADEQSYESLRLPRSLRELIHARLLKLTPAAQQVGVAAAVLGRDVALTTLTCVAALSEDVVARAVDELLRRHVLEKPGIGRVRFVHDKLREVAYTLAPPGQIVDLHARAAAELETTWQHEPLGWATLGHHFAAAELSEPAARYLRLAADHARTTYALGDASRLYDEAIHWTTRLVNLNVLDEANATPASALAELFEARGDVLTAIGRREEARDAYSSAAAHIAVGTPLRLARLHRKVGKTLEADHRHTDALSAYDTADRLLDVNPLTAAPDAHGEWLQIRLDRLWVYYFLDSVENMDALISELAPIVSSSASHSQRARFLRTHWMRDLRRERYRATESTVEIARLALSAARESGDQDQLCLDHFGLGFVLLFHDSLEDARTELETALTLATDASDLPRQARCLAYLTVIARMKGDDKLVELSATRATKAAQRSRAHEYLAVAQANFAWLAFRDGRTPDADRLAREALQTWRSLPLVYPLQWLALLPQLRAQLTFRDLSVAVSCARSMLEPTQQLLPVATAAAFARAIGEWDENAPLRAQAALTEGLTNLEGTRCA